MLHLVKYTIETNRNPSKNFKVTLEVPEKENILQFGYEYLQGEMIQENQGKNVPMFLVYDTYSIVGIKVIPRTCEGCIWDCPAQKDHMECPGGCLHDPQICSNCSIFLTFDGNWNSLPSNITNTETKNGQDEQYDPKDFI